MTEGEAKRHDDVAGARAEAERFRVRAGCLSEPKRAKKRLRYHQYMLSFERLLLIANKKYFLSLSFANHT